MQNYHSPITGYPKARDKEDLLLLASFFIEQVSTHKAETKEEVQKLGHALRHDCIEAMTSLAYTLEIKTTCQGIGGCRPYDPNAPAQSPLEKVLYPIFLRWLENNMVPRDINSYVWDLACEVVFNYMA